MIKTIIALGVIAYVGPKLYARAIPAIYLIANAAFFSRR